MLSWRPLFNGAQTVQNEILESIGVNWTHSWIWPDTLAAHGAWHEYRLRRCRGRLNERPIADILIGAFACRFDGLLTRNIKDFRALFPDLRLEEP